METKGHLCIRNLDDNGEVRFFTSINLKYVKVNELEAAINTIVEAASSLPRISMISPKVLQQTVSQSEARLYTREHRGTLRRRYRGGLQ